MVEYASVLVTGHIETSGFLFIGGFDTWRK
jgi:hypothetical protein